MQTTTNNEKARAPETRISPSAFAKRILLRGATLDELLQPNRFLSVTERQAEIDRRASLARNNYYLSLAYRAGAA